MKTKRGGFFGIAIVALLLVVAVILLVPGFATLLGRLIASLWVTVMAAVVGILGAFMGS